MKFERNTLSLALLTALMCLCSGSALATNGYFTHGVGTESKGMAGTGIGSNAAHGPIIGASNPALAVFAEDGWQAGLSIFSPIRDYKASSSLANGNFGAFTIGQGSFDSSSNAFPIPFVAKNWRLGNGNVISTTFYGRGGMNTDWDNSDATAITDPDGDLGPAPVMTLPGPFGGGEAGVDLSQAFLSINYSAKVSDSFTWGAGPVLAVQAFEAKGVGLFAGFTNTFADCFILQPPGSCDPFPTSLTDNGHEISTGVGFAGGVWFAISDSVSAGLAYQSKISMSEFDDYADLFAEDGGFDIPASTKIGLSFAGTNNVRLNLDVEHTEYNDVNSVGNPLANIGGCPTAGLGGMDFEGCLGGSNGAGFGWEDMTTYKLGIEWTGNETYTWRAGLSFGDQPIQAADLLFNILAPGVMEQHYTVGMTKNKPDGGGWSFSFMYAPSNTVTGPNLFDPTQTLEIRMEQYEFEFSYLW